MTFPPTFNIVLLEKKKTFQHRDTPSAGTSHRSLLAVNRISAVIVVKKDSVGVAQVMLSSQRVNAASAPQEKNGGRKHYKKKETRAFF